MTWTVVPEGRKTGCLVRKYLPGDVCGTADEVLEIIPRGEWKALIAARKQQKIDARNLLKFLFDQDGVGSCATEAATQMVQMTNTKQGRPFVQLNPWFMYYHTSGGSDRGSSIDEDMVFAREKGIASEAVWPRAKGWKAKPTDEAYQDALLHRLDEFWECTTIDHIGTCLLEGHFVQFGWKSHSELLVDLIDENTAMCINSWGLYSGSDQGTHPVPLSAINFSYGAYAGRTVKG